MLWSGREGLSCPIQGGRGGQGRRRTKTSNCITRLHTYTIMSSIKEIEQKTLKLIRVFIAVPGEARGCSTNTVAID